MEIRGRKANEKQTNKQTTQRLERKDSTSQQRNNSVHVYSIPKWIGYGTVETAFDAPFNRVPEEETDIKSLSGLS